MEPILNVIQILAFLVLTIALWQSWRIVKKGREEETLTEEEAKHLTVRLTVSQVCVALEAVISICRIILPFLFR